MRPKRRSARRRRGTARLGDPIYKDGALVGGPTGGNYGFRVGKSLALAMVRPEHAEAGTELEMTILGTRHRVTVIPESPYDPESARLKS